MKKNILFLSAFLLGGATLMAQQPTTTVEVTPGGDTITTTTQMTTTVYDTHFNEDSLTYYLTNGVRQVISLIDSTRVISRNAGRQVRTVKDSTGLILREETNNYYCKSYYPDVDMRLRFYWGFHNWGDQMMNGLQGMDGANSLRTSFSNYQLELMANINFSAHWMLGIGVAYESDCYKFKNDYVGLARNEDGTGYFYSATDGSIAANEDVTNSFTVPSNWNTRLVARYIDIPIRLGYKFSRGNFEVGLSVIPGFNYDGKHTGLKHSVHVGSYNHQSTDNTIEDYLNPFKCDLRLDVQKGCFGMFIQVPTMPVNTDMNVELYPFKIGFFI